MRHDGLAHLLCRLDIDSFDIIPQAYNLGGVPAFYGLFEGNDENNRMYAIANYNNDIGEYWEYSGTGWYPIDLSNDAYKLGVNYVIYAMTH